LIKERAGNGASVQEVILSQTGLVCDLNDWPGSGKSRYGKPIPISKPIH
jgi:hypothetical protein